MNEKLEKLWNEYLAEKCAEIYKNLVVTEIE